MITANNNTKYKNLLNTKIIFKNFVKSFEISYYKSVELYHQNYLKINLKNLKLRKIFIIIIKI